MCLKVQDTTYRYDDVNYNRRCGLEVEDIFWSRVGFGDPGEATSLSVNRESRIAARTWLADSSHTGISIIPMADSRTEFRGEPFLI